MKCAKDKAEKIVKTAEDMLSGGRNWLIETIEDLITKNNSSFKQMAECCSNECVPWRGADDNIGKCIYCGKTK